MRFFRRINLNKRKIITLGTIIVVFVMSLGYAALSQHMDIDGIAQIDRSWIIKVTGIEVSTTNEGVDTNNNYVSNTVAMNANLPTSSSTVTYTITLENQGNLKAKLEKIDRIEDENTNITYSISGVTEGETTLDPGEENVVTVTIKYADGITNASTPEKSLMLTFIYVERETSGGSSGGGDVLLTTDYEKGTKVELVDGSQWYVTKDSNSGDDYITLFPMETKGYFNASSAVNTMYDPHSSTNIGYYVENTVLPNIKSDLSSADGDVTGIQARLATYEELKDLVSFEDDGWYRTWAMGDSTVIAVESGEKISVSTQYSYEVHPVIIMRKSNISKIVTKNLVEQIMAYKNPTADTSISFSTTSGNGLYYTSTNTSYYILGDADLKTYYFRGPVDDNYVEFAGILWRIVRINEDGTIRLITENNVGTSKFSTAQNDNAYLGYMYGAVGATSYSAAHKNTNDSTIKDFLDTWYEDNLINYDGYISDSGFCNDKTRASEANSWNANDTALGYGTQKTYYGAYNRLVNTYTPQFRCQRWTVDWFTTATTAYGNNALKYPIGLISADEAAYAGGVLGVANTAYYLNNGTTFWTMSPQAMTTVANVWSVTANGSLKGIGPEESHGVRPVISLKADITMMSGDGTVKHPYKIYTKEESLSERILSDNNEQSDSAISFASTSAEDGTNGLYYTSTKTEDNKTVYYFRGNVTNNYVNFAGQTWRIVRINEDGSIRLITQDSVGTSPYNSDQYSNEFVGFKFGSISGESYEGYHNVEGIWNSDVSEFLNNWFKSNLINQSSFIADPGFCNDRSLYSGLGYGSNVSQYGATGRLYNNNNPQFACPRQQYDLFTLESSSKGNQDLDYQIGLLTLDEVVYAGATNASTKEPNYYLTNGVWWHTMSPRGFVNSSPATINIWSVNTNGRITNAYASNELAVRPVINLKSTVKISGGNGTASTPYVISAN